MTKLEEVARAICQEIFGSVGDSIERDASMKAARAAVEAMREPTAMIFAAGVAAEAEPENGLLAAWQAMIDAILSEKPSHEKSE